MEASEYRKTNLLCFSCNRSLYEKETGELFCKMCTYYDTVEYKNKSEKNRVKKNCEKNEEVDKTYFSEILKTRAIYLAIICIVIAIVLISLNKPREKNIILLKDILNLKKNYPSQKSDTWLHILSVFNMTIPSVKSIIMLYDHDNKTSNCLRQQLVSLYTRGQNINMKDITYQNIDEINDYGEVLEYYKPLIKEYGIFMANLQEVPGNIARIFHSLCDDISSDIKPSVFIFTIQDDKNIGNLMPLKRVNIILRNAWREVKENEIWPLLSRIVKNVVEIIPEKNISC